MMPQKIVEGAVTNKIEFIHRNLRHAEYRVTSQEIYVKCFTLFYPTISKPVGVKWWDIRKEEWCMKVW